MVLPQPDREIAGPCPFSGRYTLVNLQVQGTEADDLEAGYLHGY